jgi:hypothetical protein
MPLRIGWWEGGERREPIYYYQNDMRHIIAISGMHMPESLTLEVVQ